MAVVPGLARAAPAAELEMQEVELALEVAPVALAVGTREQVAIGALSLKLAHSPCAPWCSLLPKQYADHTVGMVLSAVEPMANCAIHQPAAEVAGALPAVTISEAMVEHLG